MKTFPSGFTAAKNRTDGPAAYWILKITVGVTSYYLSTVAVAVPAWSVTTLAWVKEWGNLTEGVSGLLDEFRIGDFSATCFADPDASPNIVSLALANNLEKNPASLYLMLADTTDAPQEFFRGYIRDYPITEGDTICTLQLQDESIRYQETNVGTELSLETYPNADPDDVGKVIPIPYGTVKQVPALCVEAGVITTLTADITAAATSIALTSASGLSGKDITIDQEILHVSSVSGNTATVTRGQGGTTAGKHNKGAQVAEKKATPLVYLAADVPINAFGQVNAFVNEKLIDITASCTLYTGQPGSAHASYPGKAVVTIADFVKVQKQIQLAADASGLSVDEGEHLHTTGATQIVTVPMETVQILAGACAFPEAVVDSNFGTCGTLNGTIRVKRVSAYNGTGNPIQRRFCHTYADQNGNNQTTIRGGWYDLTDWSGLLNMYFDWTNTYFNERAYEAWIEVEYGLSTNVGPAAGVALTGNSIADTVVGSALYVDMTRNVTDPDAVVADLLSTWAGVTSFSLVGTFPAGYGFNFVINELRRLPDWLHDLAWQCRSWYRHSCGSASLVVRSDRPASIKTLTTCAIANGKYVHSRDKSAYGEIINAITLRYDRDWKQSRSDKAYSAVLTDEDSASIADFGKQQRPELFMLDAVTSPTMAADLLAFYLGWYGVRHWLHTMTTDYRNCELEFTDPVTLGFLANTDVTVLSTDLQPGGDAVNLKLIQ